VRAALSTLAVAAALIAGATSARAEFVERSQWVMGTVLRIVVRAPVEDGLLEECFDLARACEQTLSRWSPEAELARLNAAAGGEVVVSPELFAWLERCARDHERTGGAFDPTVGTWILDPDSDAEIGMDRIRLGPGRTVFLPAGLALDSGGDGKGVAVDLIVDRLRAAGVDALVSFGESSSYGIGRGPEGDGWKLAVLDASGEEIGVAVLEDAGISVSWSLRVEQLADGSSPRRAHIFDPATGELVDVERTAVVWSRSATEAEVLSTALIVRGDPAILEKFPGAEALITPLGSERPHWFPE
jgi:thiamine biosynthesis lipoprotein